MPVYEANLRSHQDDRVVRTGTQPYKKNTNVQKAQEAKHEIVDPTDDMVFGTVKKDNHLGEELARLRGEAGISRKDMALKLASNDKLIASWESGESQIPRAMIPRIEKVLNHKLE